MRRASPASRRLALSHSLSVQHTTEPTWRKAGGVCPKPRRIYERALQLALEHGDSGLPGVADLHLGLSELHCEQNDLEGAIRHLERGEDLARHAALRETPERLCIARARLRQTQGDLDGRHELARRGRAAASQGRRPRRPSYRAR